MNGCPCSGKMDHILMCNVHNNGSLLSLGLIRLRSTPLPKLQGLEYVLNVTATDDNASGGPHPLSSTAKVIVGVDDVNNNKPIFEEVRIVYQGKKKKIVFFRNISVAQHIPNVND